MATVVGNAVFKASVDITTWPKEIEIEAEINIRMALRAMCDATLPRARIMRDGNAVPFKSGNLSSTGFVWFNPADDMTYRVEFGEGIKYARYQEFGPDGNKYTGKKTQWDYTTPGTGPHYLKTAGDSVAKEGIKKYL